jgi:hypothetical protein
MHLQNQDGSQSTTPDQLASTLVNYFQSIFSSQNQHQQQPQFPQQPNPTAPSLTDSSPLPTTDHNHNPNLVQVPNSLEGSPNSPATDIYTNSIPNMQELHDIVK